MDIDAKTWSANIAALVKQYVARSFESVDVRIKAIEDRPAPKDGTSVTIDDVAPLVKETVADAVAALPPAKDADPVDVQRMVDEAVAKIPEAKDGTSVTLDDVAPLVKETVTEAVAALPPAKDVDPVDVQRMVDESVAKLPPPKDGTGITPEQVMPDLLAAMNKALADIPAPKDGKSVTVADVLPAVEANFNGWALDFERRAQSLFRDAIAAIPKPKDGADALGFDDMEVTDHGEGNVMLRFVRGDQVKEFPIKIPCFIERGVWVEGGEYAKGDGVTWGGSFWIALVDDAKGKPGESDDFRLAVKKGRDGRSKS